MIQGQYSIYRPCLSACLLLLAASFYAHASDQKSLTHRLIQPPAAVDLLDADMRQPESPKPGVPADRLKRAEAAAAYALGQKLENGQQYQDALEMYLMAAEADPDYTPTYSRIAMIHLKNGSADEAVPYLEKKIQTYPDAARLHSLLAYCYQQQNKNEAAIKQARLALAGDFTLISNYNVLVKCMGSHGKKSALLELLNQSLRNETADVSYYMRLGELWSRLLPEAGLVTTREIQERVLPFYEKASVLEPDNAHLQFQIGQLYFDAEQFDCATTHYLKAYEKSRRIPALRERLAISLLSTRQETKAIQVLENLLEDYPERKSLYPMIAELFGRNGQWDRAVEYYRLYVEMGSPDARDYLHLADALLQDGKPEAALAGMETALKDYPAHAEIHYVRALALRSLNRNKECLAAFARAEGLGRYNPELATSSFYLEYGVALDQAGERTKAVEFLRKSIKLNPDNHQTLNYIGYMWAERGENLDEAEKMISHALKLQPKNEAYLDSMGWVLYQKGNYKKARSYLEQAAQITPEDASILEHLADTYFKLGQGNKAIDAWSKASPRAKNPQALEAKIQQARKQELVNP